MKLWARMNYRCRERVFRAGETFDVSDEDARWLLSDAPEAFEIVEEETKAPEAPPVDKMVRKPTTRKSRAKSEPSGN